MRLGRRWARTVIGTTVLGWVGMVGCSSGDVQEPPPDTGSCTDTVDCSEAPEPAPDDSVPPPVEQPQEGEDGGTQNTDNQPEPVPPPPPGPGATLWVAREGTPQDDLSLDSAVDASGDIFTAAVYGIDDLDTRSPTDDKVTLVITRHSAEGETLWQRTFDVFAPDTPAGLRADVSAHLAVDPAGGLFVAGNVKGVMDFGTQKVGDGAFVVRLDATGNPAWASPVSGNTPTVTDVAVDAQGRALVAFNAPGFADFGGGTHGAGAVVVTYSAQGAAESALPIGRPEGQTDAVEVTSLAVDARGRMAVGGRYVGVVRFGSQRVQATRDGSPFLALYTDGALTWAKALQHAQGTVTSVGMDSQGEVVATGPFLGTVDWAGKKLQGHPYRFSPFLVSARAGGDERWGRDLGDGLQVGALAVESSGEVVVGGFTYNRIEDGTASSDGMGSSQPVALRYDASGAVVATRLFLSDPPEPRGELVGVEAMPSIAVLPGGDAILFGHTDRDSDFGSGRRTASRSDIFLFRLKR